MGVMTDTKGVIIFSDIRLIVLAPCVPTFFFFNVPANFTKLFGEIEQRILDINAEKQLS
jgi:hypothetical protein